ncbi:MAG TPA: ATP-grasp domain-containing protein [Verrucomicrobiae bacterium]|nr:ATP-grasp domain-containing protein [Verrucomicrobiae bacterium]
MVAAALFSEAFISMPLAADPNFSASLVQLLRKNRVSLWIPILDEEIVHGARLSESANRGICRIQAPSVAVAQLCFDKLEMGRWLNKNGIPTPETSPLCSVSWRKSGWFVKPRRGRGSDGARLLFDRATFDAVQHSSEDLIAQPVCKKPEVTIDVFISQNGRMIRALCRERIEIKAGVCTKARVFRDDELESLARQLGIGLNLRGAFCFQVLRDPSGKKWTVTDVNPRPGAGTAISAAVGFDTGSAMLADLTGGDFKGYIRLPRRDRFVVRTYQEHVFC